jgi:N-acyl homoserine lactone hydrolase
MVGGDGTCPSSHRPRRRRKNPAPVQLLVEGERWPVYVHVIDHPGARVLVDTGMTELHLAVADLDPRLRPLSEQAFDLAGIDVVVNTHLHFDHCGGNHLFAGRPIYVQRRELDDARSEDDYTIREWVEAPGVRYVPVDGEHELLPGLRLVPAPGHTRGSQMVVVRPPRSGTGGRPTRLSGRTTSAGRPASGHSGCRARRRPRRGAFPATGMALTAGPIARSKTGEHDPPLRGQCPPETRALPHARATASPPVVELPEPKHSSWRLWTPCTLTSTVFGLATLTLNIRRVRPSPTSITPA